MPWIQLHQPTGIMLKVFINSLGDQSSIPGQVISKTQKMVLDPSLLNTQCNLLTACHQSCLFDSYYHLLTAWYWSCLSVSFSHLPCQYTGLHNSAVKQQRCPSPQYFFHAGSSWLKFAYVANPVPSEMRCVTYKLPTQRCSCFRFSILPVLYMQDKFAPFSNFEVGHFAYHLFFVCLFLCGYERNSIHTALLSHFIFLFHYLFFIQLWMIAEYT